MVLRTHFVRVLGVMGGADRKNLRAARALVLALRSQSVTVYRNVTPRLSSGRASAAALSVALARRRRAAL